MATRTETLNTLYSSTWRQVRPGITDQIFDATPLTAWLSAQGRRRFDDSGGRYIDCNLQYATNSSITWIGKGGVVPLQDIDMVKPAKWDWYWMAGNLMRFNVDEQMNRSRSSIFNMAKAKFDNLKQSMSSEMETTFFQTTKSNALSFDPLGVSVYSTPTTGTVAGIDRATDTWWRNQYKSFTAPFAVNGSADMLNLWNNCSIGNDHPDFIITDQTSHELYESTIEPKYYTQNRAMAELGFSGCSYKGIPFEFSPSCTSGYLYMLNSKYMEMVFNPSMYFEMTEWKPIPDQPFDKVAQIVVQGNLIFTSFRMQGVGTGLSA